MPDRDTTCFENTFSFPHSQELNMYYCGKRISSLNHSYGPEIRRHFLVVFVKEGQATLLSHKDTPRLSEGDLFVMFPNEEIHYVVDKGCPWSISWVGLYGSLVYDLFSEVGITPQNPIINVESVRDNIADIFEEIYKLSFSANQFDKLSVISLLYKFFSTLTSNSALKSQIDYVKEAARLIEYNYDKNISIENIAERLFINKSYLCRLFKAEKGLTPKEYLIKKRINRAVYLLKNSDASINTIALSIGFSDPLYFSRIFKKHLGVSPSLYRQSVKRKNNL